MITLVKTIVVILPSLVSLISFLRGILCTRAFCYRLKIRQIGLSHKALNSSCAILRTKLIGLSDAFLNLSRQPGGAAGSILPPKEKGCGFSLTAGPGSTPTDDTAVQY